MARRATSSRPKIRDRINVEALFHVPEGYFLSHSVGCQPRVIGETLERDYSGPWQSGTNWGDWMPMVARFRTGIAGFLGVPAASICPQTNISSGLTKIIHSLPRRPGRDAIVLSKQDFPTVGFVLKLAETAGYRLRFVDGDPADADVWAAAIDARTAVVHITHALSDSSYLLPVTEICDLAKTAGALSIVDIAQSLIAVPTPVTKWDPDFVLGTGVKFLCAGPGACFLYAKPERIAECRPIDVGWFSHENPFEMDILDFRYADDAMRFFGGTPSPAPLICANAAMEMWESLDLELVHTTIQSHLDALIAATPKNWLVSPTDRRSRGGSYVVKPDNAEALTGALKAKGIQHDIRTTGFRFSVHGYTPSADVKKLADIMRCHTT